MLDPLKYDPHPFRLAGYQLREGVFKTERNVLEHEEQDQDFLPVAVVLLTRLKQIEVLEGDEGRVGVDGHD